MPPPPPARKLVPVVKNSLYEEVSLNVEAMWMLVLLVLMSSQSGIIGDYCEKFGSADQRFLTGFVVFIPSCDAAAVK